MTDLPRAVSINEEGPREGFQIEPGPIPTAAKVELVDALSATGLTHIQVCSFVNPARVPGWADAEAVVAGITPRPGVRYTALWFNERGLQRALAHRDRLTVEGGVTMVASVPFLQRNLNRDPAGNLAEQRRAVAQYRELGLPVRRLGVQAAFGCNYAGAVPVAAVLDVVAEGIAVADAAGHAIEVVSLADTMGWANPASVERLVGAVRARWPELRINLHLHDTRGLGIANAHAALRLGVASFDATVAGLGGCPFAGQPGAAGNVCTEDLAFLCAELGIETGLDLEALIAAAHLAERIVGHRLPGEFQRGGPLRRMAA